MWAEGCQDFFCFPIQIQQDLTVAPIRDASRTTQSDPSAGDKNVLVGAGNERSSFVQQGKPRWNLAMIICLAPKNVTLKKEVSSQDPSTDTLQRHLGARYSSGTSRPTPKPISGGFGESHLCDVWDGMDLMITTTTTPPPPPPPQQQHRHHHHHHHNNNNYNYNYNYYYYY